MKEITVFSYGDANSLRTWSNVPYFLTKTIESKGVKVNRVDVSANHYINAIWNRIILKFIRLFFKNSTYDFQRTPFFRWQTERKMKRAVQQFSHTDAFISISFSYHPKKFTSKPVMMFCDWTYDYYFKYFLKRSPDRLELQEIQNQRKLFKTADEVVFLFPDVAKYEKKLNHKNNIFYLGNVINSTPMSLSREMLKEKFESKRIVFIGSPKYMPGLMVLIGACKQLFNEIPNLTLDIIGIKESQCIGENFSNRIHFWGYLDKSNEVERKQYYNIVDSATVFVNTTPVWSSFSATLDVMYHYTPIIISEYRSFTETFGESVEFGEYSENDVDEVSQKILSIMQNSFDDYSKLANTARQSVEPFSWDNYVNKMLKILKTGDQ